MQKNWTVTPAQSPKIILLDKSALQTSLVVAPTGSTYTVAYTCHHSPEKAPASSWVEIPNMTAASATATNEFGSISGLKFSVTGGTKIDIDILQPR